ncbi:MAG: hypothetical protein ACJ739_06200 [Acidimicrobiales bacterium]
MAHMLMIEVRRCLSRRLVRWLVVVAVVGCVGTAYFAHRTASQARPLDPFRLAELHETTGDTFLGVGAFFLMIGAVAGGASMVGAEWRAGTFVTLLTWEPDRRRVAVAKLLACGLVAAAIAIGLQILFTAAFLPAALGPGTTDGMDAAWWRSVADAIVRIACLTGLVATFAASVAMLGRSTAAALGVAFAYLLIIENLLRAWKPWTGRFLVGENGAIFVSGADLHTEDFTRSTTTAGLTLLGYVLVTALAAVATFWRRDLASSS